MRNWVRHEYRSAVSFTLFYPSSDDRLEINPLCHGVGPLELAIILLRGHGGGITIIIHVVPNRPIMSRPM